MTRDEQRAIFVRSLFLQACFNGEGMQNLGFLLGLEPLLRRAYGDGPAYREAALRHLGFFNTQPYAAGLILGAVGALEERRAGLPEGDRPAAGERIGRLKAALGSSMAAMGDSFFWGALRPATAAWSLLVGLALWTARVPYALAWGGLAGLVVYNAPALWLRWAGPRIGYERGEGVVAWLAGLGWERRAARARRAGLAAAVPLALVSLAIPPLGGALAWGNALLLAAALGLVAAGVRGGAVYALACAAGTVLAWTVA